MPLTRTPGPLRLRTVSKSTPPSADIHVANRYIATLRANVYDIGPAARAAGIEERIGKMVDSGGKLVVTSEAIPEGGGVHGAPRHGVLDETDLLEAIVSLPSVDVQPEAVVDYQESRVLDADESALPRAHRRSVPPPTNQPNPPKHG